MINTQAKREAIGLREREHFPSKQIYLFATYVLDLQPNSYSTVLRILNHLIISMFNFTFLSTDPYRSLFIAFLGLIPVRQFMMRAKADKKSSILF